jgi:Fe-S cluster assembly protein SufB
MPKNNQYKKCATCAKKIICPKKYIAKPGLSEDIVHKISKDKNEPEWMLNKRLEALNLFQKTPMPNWGPDLSNLNLNNIIYYSTHGIQEQKSWENVPSDIKNTFNNLGIIKAEKSHLSGVGAQYDSQVVYHSLKQEFKDKGIIFENLDVAIHKYPELIKEYFMTKCVPINDHKFSMLHAAVFSGGTFIYIPKNTKIDTPLQAYFRMNARKGGQFEHTLIIADENSSIHYIEGCSAPRHAQNSLHAGCVELFVKKGAKIKYSSIENWSKNTYNLNTKRAIVEENGTIEWVNGNTGSKTTMLYPSSILIGDNSKSESLSIAFASKGQNQDTGVKVIHIGKNTSSITKAKSIVKDGGITTYRGLVKIAKDAHNSKSTVDCDTLLLDSISQNNTYPIIDNKSKKSTALHEAKVGKISPQQIYYLQSRGLNEEEAKKLIITGFISPIVKKFPLDYALELNKLIEMQMDSNMG